MDKVAAVFSRWVEAVRPADARAEHRDRSVDPDWSLKREASMRAAASDQGAPGEVIWLADYRGGPELGPDGPPQPPRLGARKPRNDTLLSEAILADAAGRSRFADWRQCA